MYKINTGNKLYISQFVCIHNYQDPKSSTIFVLQINVCEKGILGESL